MSNYSKSTNFATKDNLTPGDPLKIVRGTEIDTEFNNIATAIATKTDNASAAITGGTINDTTIGATTASTGAFTTLAASGNVTLSGGTANGVTYLNGSKVVTSGSALWFDGTNFGVGTGGNTLNQQSVVYKAGANAIYQQVANGSTGLGATNGIRVGLTSAGVGEWYSPTAAISYIDNTEQMRLTSTGLGIGTSSPSQKLDVNGNITSTAWIGRANGSAPSADCAIYRATDNTLGFSTASTERMRLDSSGNLGLGVTPSAWAGGQPALQIGSGTAINNRSAVLSQFSSNQRWDGSSHRYLNNGTATLYTQNDGAHLWATASSGTAGNAITFTQVATIDASGNFLVGTTSFSYNPTQGATISGGSVGAIGIGHASGTADGNGYLNFAYNGTNIGSVTQNSTTSVAYNTSSDYRLKNTIEPMTGALAKVALLKPVTYKWNADGSNGEGFIAHELAEVCPQAVTGEKDAVDAEGNPKYQGIDTSFLVATLTAAIQELKAEFDAYKASHP